ncbi:MAG: diguanylate cyclase [Bdellovibrionota bacterium]
MTDGPNVAREKPKILCIDDESSILAALSRLLSPDFLVLSATSTDEARDLLDHHRDVAIVMTDHSMPGESGTRFLRYVQTAAPDAVRAILSGRVDVQAMAEAINNAQVHRVILKPWDNEYLKLQMIEALASHGVLREKRELERLSITDPVTQVRNHRYFQDHLKIEVERTIRHQRSLSLVMIDIDHFKKYNDTYGHPAGDALLRGTAKRLLDQLRALDTVARYGGEEFALVMPDTSYENAMLVAERVRKSIEKEGFPGPDGTPTFVTISLGVATAPKHGGDSAELVKAADAALYTAKRQGRNQSVGA